MASTSYLWVRYVWLGLSPRSPGRGIEDSATATHTQKIKVDPTLGTASSSPLPRQAPLTRSLSPLLRASELRSSGERGRGEGERLTRRHKRAGDAFIHHRER